ncbi:hypothetical protein SSX86_028889 [Deinandra increscens subsp. villosa]|uniref:NAD-dependent epimerase/dehydratase domain-containing protein n=1 Tax=Deinandra increscens subsp. villosa TaxID=3103831 RepID=A0AAP0GK29_9ASTR
MPEYCVTGGTGFIAAYIIRSLLEKGDTVRTTVRDPENVKKVGYLLEMKGAHDRLKLMKADLMLWYAYAKTIAEKDAWSVAKESGINLVVVNPSYVVGPLLAPQPTSTLQMILAYVTGAVEEYPNTTVGFVHIDDVVAAHILAMEKKEAAGRLICSSTVAHWSEVIHMLKSKYPSYPYVDKCSSRKGDNNPHSMDSSKILQLGLPPLKTLEQMFDDCITSFQEKGFL